MDCERAEGGLSQAEALRVDDTLQTLYLWDNRVGEGGAQAIAEALRENHTLQTLDLSK